MIKRYKQAMKATPDYKRIYTDMIEQKYPDKLSLCESILEKEVVSTLDVISLNNLLVDSNASDCERLNQSNQSLRSYDKCSVLEILAYQKENGLNNLQLARHFNLSRNTLTRWKNAYFVKIGKRS